MKLKHINPFVDSVHDFFRMMLSSKVEKGQLGLRKAERATYEITSLIGLSGVAKGSVALSFPMTTAINIANSLLGSDYNELNRSVTDAVAEMVNIVAGSAKSKFVRGEGPPIDLSLPNVIIGSNYVVSYPSMTTWLEVPFSSDQGDFSMRVTFEMNE
jgi:chemotaxis protein CheX